MASSNGHVAASPGAWLSVWLVVLSFVFGTLALPLHSVVLWVLCGVAMLAGIVAGIASRIMEQAY